MLLYDVHGDHMHVHKQLEAKYPDNLRSSALPRWPGAASLPEGLAFEAAFSEDPYCYKPDGTAEVRLQAQRAQSRNKTGRSTGCATGGASVAGGRHPAPRAERGCDSGLPGKLVDGRVVPLCKLSLRRVWRPWLYA